MQNNSFHNSIHKKNYSKTISYLKNGGGCNYEKSKKCRVVAKILCL